MTESQEKELFAMFRKQHEQAIAGDYVFMPTITPLHFGYLLDRIEALEQKYNQLILTVGSKFEGESRHETALRYIRSAEDFGNGGAAQQDKGKETV